jgi:hypothetical protein
VFFRGTERADPGDEVRRVSDVRGNAVTSKQQQDMGEATPCWRSIGPGIATFFLPLIALFLVIQALWILLPAEWFETRTLSTLDISALKLKGFARVIDGGMSFSIMSAAIWGAGLVAGLLSFIVMRRTLPARQAVAVWMIAASVGFLVACWEGNLRKTECESSYRSTTVHVDKNEGFRSVIIDNVICVAEHSLSSGTRVLGATQWMIIFNTFVGFVGAAVVMGALGVLAMRYGNWSDVARLRGRLADFRTLTLMASVLFVLNALVTKALVSWTQGLLASEDDAASFARLGSALLNYWAAQASTVLIVALGLAAIFIQIDIGSAVNREADRRRREVQRHYTETRGDEDLAAAKWQAENELSFNSATVVTATIGTIAPFLAGPAVDLVTKVLH